MELVLNKVLEKFRIENATWNRNNEMCSVTFSLPNGGQHEQVLKVFKFWGKNLRDDLWNKIIRKKNIKNFAYRNRRATRFISGNVTMYRYSTNKVKRKR